MDRKKTTYFCLLCWEHIHSQRSRLMQDYLFFIKLRRSHLGAPLGYRRRCWAACSSTRVPCVSSRYHWPPRHHLPRFVLAFQPCWQLPIATSLCASVRPPAVWLRSLAVAQVLTKRSCLWLTDCAAKKNCLWCTLLHLQSLRRTLQLAESQSHLSPHFPLCHLPSLVTTLSTQRLASRRSQLSSLRSNLRYSNPIDSLRPSWASGYFEWHPQDFSSESEMNAFDSSAGAAWLRIGLSHKNEKISHRLFSSFLVWGRPATWMSSCRSQEMRYQAENFSSLAH